MCICALLQCQVSWALCLWDCDPESVLPPGNHIPGRHLSPSAQWSLCSLWVTPARRVTKPVSFVVLALLGWRRLSLTLCVLFPPQALQAATSSGRSLAQVTSLSPGTVPHSWGLACSALWLFTMGPGWLSWLPWDHQCSVGRDTALPPPRKQPRPNSLPALNSAQILCLTTGLLGMYSAWLADLPSGSQLCPCPGPVLSLSAGEGRGELALLSTSHGTHL